MTRTELATAIQRLAVTWTEGDREAAELKSCDVIRGLALIDDGWATRWDRRAAADALTAAHASLGRGVPGRLASRRAFLDAYIRAMTHWFDGHCVMASGRGRAVLASTAVRGSLPGEAAIALAMQLKRLLSSREIDAADSRLFLCNRVLGVPQADLADLFGVDRRHVAGRIRAVSRLLGGTADDPAARRESGSPGGGRPVEK